ncbi:MAG: ArsR family transcriptional regulator [Firmicutes bacterium]|nr:ArsR family transcriptional regulator [Candidatus Alectryobacillus merdavium]
MRKLTVLRYRFYFVILIFNEIKNKGEVCACKLLDIVKCNQPTLSHHLKILVDSGF